MSVSIAHLRVTGFRQEADVFSDCSEYLSLKVNFFHFDKESVILQCEIIIYREIHESSQFGNKSRKVFQLLLYRSSIMQHPSLLSPLQFDYYCGSKKNSVSQE